MTMKNHNSNSLSNGEKPKAKVMESHSTSKIIIFLTIATISVMLYYVFETSVYGDGILHSMHNLSLIRIVSAILIPLYIATSGLKKQSLDPSGAALGVIVAFVLTISRWSFLWSLMAFFVTSSKATKYKQELKKKIEGDDFKPGGQRNWVQVICNGGVALFMAVQYIHSVGIEKELPIDFDLHYFGSWVSLGVLGSLGCCAGDTWASELGTVLNISLDSKQEPRLITQPWRHVPKGTNGGVSLVGLIASFAGGLVVGVAFYLGIIMNVGFNVPNQANIILVGGIAGFLGSFIDSVMGATLQYSGISKKTGAIIEKPPQDSNSVIHITGTNILDNHEVNLLSSLLTALLVPPISASLF